MTGSPKKLYCYIAALLVYLLVPKVIIDTGSAMLVLLLIMPALVLGISFIYAYKWGFNFLHSLLMGGLFVPTIFIYFNESAWIYTLLYLAFSLLGQGLGFVFSRLDSFRQVEEDDESEE